MTETETIILLSAVAIVVIIFYVFFVVEAYEKQRATIERLKWMIWSMEQELPFPDFEDKRWKWNKDKMEYE